MSEGAIWAIAFSDVFSEGLFADYPVLSNKSFSLRLSSPASSSRDIWESGGWYMAGLLVVVATATLKTREGGLPGAFPSRTERLLLVSFARRGDNSWRLLWGQAT